MDVLVAEAKVIRQRVPTEKWQVACLAPKVRSWAGAVVPSWTQERWPVLLCVRRSRQQYIAWACLLASSFQAWISCSTPEGLSGIYNTRC
jgi:hypothetical protein